MAKKLCTKQEAIRIGYYVAGEEGTTRNGVTTLTNSSEWYGKWHETEFEIEGPGWRIWAKRTKHQDGRIRDAHNSVEGETAFAIWCVENLPGNDADRQMIESRMLEPANLAFSVSDTASKKFIRSQAAPATVQDAVTLIVGSRLVREDA